PPRPVRKTGRLESVALIVAVVAGLRHHGMRLLPAIRQGKYTVLGSGLVERYGPGALEVNRGDQKKDGTAVARIDNLIDLSFGLLTHPGVDGRGRGGIVEV